MQAVFDKTEVPKVEIPSDGEKFTVHRLRVEDYEKMIEYGIFDENDKIELWEGVLVEMSPKGMAHVVANNLAYQHFYDLFRGRCVLRSQDPIRLNDYSEPEPDLVMAEPKENLYILSHPMPPEIYFVMEVADSTLAGDRRKAQSYAKSNVRQYLILNLNERTIEDYREPSENGYRNKRTVSAGETFTLVAFPDVEIQVSALLPPE